MMNSGREALFITRYSSLVTHHSSLITRYSSLVTHHSLLITRHSSFIIHHSSFTTHHPSRHFNCAHQPDAGIHDDVDRNCFEQRCESSFARERFDESSVREVARVFSGDAAGEEAAAARQEAQRHVAGFGAVDVDEDLERVLRGRSEEHTSELQ